MKLIELAEAFFIFEFKSIGVKEFTVIEHFSHLKLFALLRSVSFRSDLHGCAGSGVFQLLFSARWFQYRQDIGAACLGHQNENLSFNRLLTLTIHRQFVNSRFMINFAKRKQYTLVVGKNDCYKAYSQFS